MLRKALFWLFLCIAATSPASAQSNKPLRDVLSDLFSFGACGEPLPLATHLQCRDWLSNRAL